MGKSEVTREIYIVNTKIHPCETGIFQDHVYMLNIEGRKKFINKIKNLGATNFDVPFLSLYRPNSQGKPFLGPVREDSNGLRRWDLQYEPENEKILIGGAIHNSLIGRLTISDYIMQLLSINSLLKNPLRGIIQYLNDNNNILEDLYPEEIIKLESKKIKLKRFYLA